MGTPAAGSGVVSIARGAYHPDYQRLASHRVASAREKLGMSHAEYADYLAGQLGWRVTPEAAQRWEEENTPPGDVLLASAMAAGDGLLPIPALPLLDSVPQGFPAAALAGDWVTAYQFDHGGALHHHADIAHVTADGECQVRAVNHPPEPRTQGRACPFRNEIEGRLFGRHLIGTWRNTSDTRYYGSFQLAVLPGETVMDGHYTGLASDIEVSVHHWRWVRLEDSGDLTGAVLRDPSEVWGLVMARTRDEPPLRLADIREDG